jgi:hypothetical protein
MGGYARSTSKWSKPQLGEVIFIYCNTSKHRVTNAEAFREHGKRCRARAENHGPARDGLGVKIPCFQPPCFVSYHATMVAAV